MEHEKLPLSILSYCSVFNKTEDSRNIAKNILEKRLTEKYKVNKNDLNEIIICEQNKIERRGEYQNNYLIFTPKSLEEIFEFLNYYKKEKLELSNKISNLSSFSELTISETIFLWDIFCRLSNIIKSRRTLLENTIRRVKRDKSESMFFDILSNPKETENIIKDYKREEISTQKLQKERVLLEEYKNFAKIMRTLSIILSGTEHYNKEFLNVFGSNPYYYTTNQFFETEKEYMKNIKLYSVIEKELKVLSNTETNLSLTLRLK